MMKILILFLSKISDSSILQVGYLRIGVYFFPTNPWSHGVISYTRYIIPPFLNYCDS
jgi:hypothetical protein